MPELIGAGPFRRKKARFGAACSMSDKSEVTEPAWLLIGGVAGPERSVRVPFVRLDAALLARLGPRHVVCALFAADCDAMIVAERLTELGWRGRLTVVAQALPDRRMVERELQAIAPWISVVVVAAL